MRASATPTRPPRRVLLPALAALALSAAAALAAGCGTTEESGAVGDTLEAEGIEVAVERVDTAVPVPASDITGLSRPSPGTKLVGARVRVCSDNEQAIGPWDFGLKTSSGDGGTLKFPQRNYAKGFESLRADCGGGWVVFEIPKASAPEAVTFGFEDTGSARPGDRVEFNLRFSWALA